MTRIYVLHENDDWVVPLRAAFEARDLPYTEWHLARGRLDLSAAPPEGVFYNRMSASSHTRGHVYAPELTAGVLAWLERHGRRVLNGRRALQLEISKVEQYLAFEQHGIRYPRTEAAVGADELLEAAASFEGAFITKHNRAGKGLGVQLFRSVEALKSYLEGPTFEESRDGVTLIQQYIESPDQSITRVEFVGGEFTYAVRVDTSEGFELCPADACRIDDAFCPVGESPASIGASAQRPMFEIVEGFESELIPRYRALLAANDVDVGAFEFIVDADGVAYTYDLNTNTNYNSEAEARAGVSNMDRLAEVLGEELARL